MTAPIDAAVNAAIAYASSLSSAMVFGDWDGYDAACVDLARTVRDVNVQAVARVSGAADEVEFYTDCECCGDPGAPFCGYCSAHGHDRGDS